MNAQHGSQPRQFGPWLDTLAAADYLSYTGKAPRRSVYKFIQRHGITVRHDGDRLLLARADVDRALEQSHARQSAARSTSTVSPTFGQCSTLQKGASQ